MWWPLLLPQALCVSLLFSWLVWSLADEQRRSSRWLGERWLVPLGFVLRGYLGAPTPWLGPGVIVALVLASVLLHRCFEEPLRRGVMRSA